MVTAVLAGMAAMSGVFKSGTARTQTGRIVTGAEAIVGEGRDVFVGVGVWVLVGWAVSVGGTAVAVNVGCGVHVAVAVGANVGGGTTIETSVVVGTALGEGNGTVVG